MLFCEATDLVKAALINISRLTMGQMMTSLGSENPGISSPPLYSG